MRLYTCHGNAIPPLFWPHTPMRSSCRPKGGGPGGGAGCELLLLSLLLSLLLLLLLLVLLVVVVLLLLLLLLSYPREATEPGPPDSRIFPFPYPAVGCSECAADSGTAGGTLVAVGSR